MTGRVMREEGGGGAGEVGGDVKEVLFLGKSKELLLVFLLSSSFLFSFPFSSSS